MRKVGRKHLFLALVSLPLSGAAAQGESLDCLFASFNSGLSRDCSPDPHDLAQERVVRDMIDGLGFKPGEIVFLGCAQGRYSTLLQDPRTQVMRIHYPRTSTYRTADYLGPIAHELGHAVQLRTAGSITALRQRLGNDSTRVELGADFLAGIMFKRHLTARDQAAFEQSLDLLGNYTNGSLASHSTPEARTAAFRMGFYYAMAHRSLEEASADFQENRFAAIIRAQS